MTVSLLSTYRVGTSPPPACSLQPGELYVEIHVATGVPPRLWVGTSQQAGRAGNVALIVSDTPVPTPATISIDPIANPSSDNTVTITGTVAPGCAIELAALAGTDAQFYQQLNEWSPYDAADGTFAVTWWLPAADNVRVRVRMHDDPQTYADSNLFAVTDPALARP